MRLDIPTLQCDRCHKTTQDMTEMAKYQQLKYYHVSGTDTWDFCPDCWTGFLNFCHKIG